MSFNYTLSIVNYYNTTPFLYGLKYSPKMSNLKLELDVPSTCAKKLILNQVDIGLVPVAVIPQLLNCHIISDYCIGANGKVDSVKLFAEKPLEELTHVLLDYQSKTSVQLVQVLNKYFWKKNIQFVDAKEGFENQVKGSTGAVIIGDRTFGLTKYPFQYDLAEEWKNYTRLPFVFACWVSTRQPEPEFIESFNNALRFGIENIDDAIKENPNKFEGFDAADYLKHKISYDFNGEKRKGLELFLKMI